MELEIQDQTIKILGDVLEYDDFRTFKEKCLALVKDIGCLNIEFIGTTNLSSHTMGFLIKERNKDRYPFQITCDQEQIYDTFTQLGLVEILNVRKLS